MPKAKFRCGALNQNDTRCRSNATKEQDYWRCNKHADWHDTATPGQKQLLALLEIAELIEEANEL